jgi:hypothetical protein
LVVLCEPLIGSLIVFDDLVISCNSPCITEL